MKQTDFDCDRTDEVVCPYCGKEQGDSWEFADDENETECGHCGETICFERNVYCDYTSWKKKEAQP